MMEKEIAELESVLKKHEVGEKALIEEFMKDKVIGIEYLTRTMSIADELRLSRNAMLVLLGVVALYNLGKIKLNLMKEIENGKETKTDL